MKSALRHTPMATLGAVAPSGPDAVTEGRAIRVEPPDATGVPTVVVGAPRSGKSSVTNALLGAPAPALTADLVAVAAAATTGGAPVARPVTSAYLTFRHGDVPAAYAYVPGRRTPHALSPEQVRAGDAGTLVRGGPGRPPRRVEVLDPTDLLRRVTLVDTPGTGGFDHVYTELVLDALDRDASLLFVTEASTALQQPQLDFLARVEQRGVPVTFVLTKIDAHPQWPAVLSVNLKLVHDHTPRLATAAWYAVSTLRDCDGGSPAVEEAARGLAGLGIGALRRALTEPAPGEVAVRAPDPPAPSSANAAATPAPRVADGTTDERWPQVLDREIRAHGTAAAQWLAVDLAAIYARCVRQTGSPAGRARLAYVFDRELHALSVRATHAVEQAALAIMRQVFAEILESPPDRAALERIRGATRRAVETAEAGGPDWDRVLLVTATSGIAVTAGPGAAASLAAVAPRPAAEELLPPIGVALSANCYSARHRDSDRRVCRGWLRQSAHTLEADLARELTQRFAYLREALGVVAADTVDHGVLLA
jgi:hypothetical protein